MTENYRPATFRTIILSFGLLLTAFAFLILNPAGVFKTAGYIFLFIPGQLGLIQPVRSAEVQDINLTIPSQEITFAQPGRYFGYYHFPFLSLPGGPSYRQPAAITIRSQETGQPVFVTMVKRGVQFYDTPFAPGRPYYAFTVDQPGTYQVTHETMDGIISVAPDYTTGKETRIRSIAMLEIAVIGLIAGVLMYRKYQRLQKSLVPLKQASAVRSKAFDQLIASEKQKHIK